MSLAKPIACDYCNDVAEWKIDNTRVCSFHVLYYQRVHNASAEPQMLEEVCNNELSKISNKESINKMTEKEVKVADSPFYNYTPAIWAIRLIEKYGQIDGDHHKTWVLDQVARILNGSPIKIVKAEWTNGEIEWRYSVGECEQYSKWVDDMKGETDDDGSRQYDYNAGIAP